MFGSTLTATAQSIARQVQYTQSLAHILPNYYFQALGQESEAKAATPDNTSNSSTIT